MRPIFGCLIVLSGGFSGGGAGLCLATFVAQGNDFALGFLALIGCPLGFLLGVLAGIFALKKANAFLKTEPKNSRKILFSAGALLLLASLFAEMLLFLNRSNTPPSDQTMITHFQKHRKIFDQLAKMVQNDHGLERVDDDWTKPRDPQTIGVSEERIALYRQLFAQVDVPRGFSAYAWKKGNIEFSYWGRGSALSDDYSKDFSYCPTPPKPILPSLDNLKYKKGYRHISGNWYLYYEYLPG